MSRTTRRREIPSPILLTAALLVWGLLVMPPPPSQGAQVPDDFVDEQVSLGFHVPVGLDFLDDGRLLIAELRSGKVRMIVDGSIGAVDPLVVVDSVQTLGGERGMTGLAIDPEWPTRPYIYVLYSALGDVIRLSRYSVGGDLTDGSSSNLIVDPASRYDLLRDIPDVRLSHNGGTIRFGPDGKLYVGTGDDQTSCTAQDSISLRGSMLRLEVAHLPSGPGIVQDKAVLVPLDNPLANHPNLNTRLVWASGLRNPFRFHIDGQSGDVFIADVGTRIADEINVASAPGENFGWPMFEGTAPTGVDCDPPVTATFSTPIYQYDYASVFAGRTSVVSAGVYRNPGCDDCGFPAEYEGDYFVADFFAGFLRRLVRIGPNWQLAAAVPGQPSSLNWGFDFHRATDFAVSPITGDLYYCRATVDTLGWTGAGDVRRVVYAPPPVSVPVAFDEPASLRIQPTPSRGTVEIRFALDRRAPVSLEIFDLGGRRVRSLAASQSLPAGTHRWSWNGRDRDGVRVAPGIYLARLQAGERVRSRRIAIVR